jgi:hypothetical protein
MKKLIGLSLFITVLMLFSCKEEYNENYQAEASNPEYLHRSMKRLTDVIVHNIFSPPVASRVYAYPSIAAYEVMAQGDSIYKSLEGQLTDFKNVPKPIDSKEYCFPLASVQAFLTASKVFIFTEKDITDFENELLAEFKAIKMPRKVYERSIAYGNEMAAHIIEWSKSDMYAETRTYSKYALTDDEGKWEPTPPDFMDGIEPHWREIRPFVLDSAQQFIPVPPTAFSKEKNSLFYKEAMEAYEKGKKYPETQLGSLSDETKENIAIAEFWDCNPFVSHHQGHVMFATKKITPGGHWINITAIVTRQAKSDFMETTAAYALTSVALMDGFISCWDEKYRSNLIRPETYINRYIDNNWKPLLQTPPFPEYTSGHSVISSAASVALTSIYGENFAFDDTSEEEYGLPTRSFKSFYAASEEAAVSRLYGGIHYMPAIENGVTQGKNVGNYIIEKIKLK